MVSKDELDTEESTGCMNSCGPKGTTPAEATSNSKKIEPASLTIAELRLSEDIT